MQKVALRGLLTRKLRSVLTGFAVVIGVAFVVGTLVFTDTINESFKNLFERTQKGVDVELESRQAVKADFSQAPTMPQSVLAKVKSTLMHLLAGLDRPTSGTVVIDGLQLGGLDDKGLTQLRRDRLGFVFQAFNLVPVLTAEENITLPLALAGRKPDQKWLDQLIDTVALRDRLTHRPSELSGGQQQRVAVARALVHRPAVLFADEPTGNLDSHASEEVLRLLRQAVDEFGQTVIMVTHDATAAAVADRIVVLSDGKVVHDGGSESTEGVLDLMKAVA